MLLVLKYLEIDLKNYQNYLRKDISIKSSKDLVYNFISERIKVKKFSQNKFFLNDLEKNKIKKNILYTYIIESILYA